MDLKEKELLLKDLSSRLFYNPWVQFNLEYGDNGHKEGSYKAHISSIDPTSGWLEVDYFETETLEKEWSGNIENVKPYLRSMSSMTDEEILELYKITYDTWYSDSLYYKNDEWINFRDSIKNNNLCFKNCIWLSDINKVINWLLKHHFDYRFPGLIEKGLALEAPTGMYR